MFESKPKAIAPFSHLCSGSHSLLPFKYRFYMEKQQNTGLAEVTVVSSTHPHVSTPPEMHVISLTAFRHFTAMQKRGSLKSPSEKTFHRQREYYCVS